MSVEFLKQNYLDTTTSVVVDSNTNATQYLIDRDPSFQYVSVGYSGVTNTTIRINFGVTQTVSRIALVGHNLKGFTIYYNGVTASTFGLTSTCHTTTSDFSTNSDTSLYLSCNPVDCTSVSIQCKTTMVSGVEKAIGYMVVSDVLLSLSRIPSAKDYKPELTPHAVVHTLSDGGTRIQTVADKMSVSINYKWLTLSQRDSLKSLYDLHQEMIFCPFGTSTGWDSVCFPAVWAGPFDFYTYSDDALTAGFSGAIKLLETPS